jgi:hypothetical protein
MKTNSLRFVAVCTECHGCLWRIVTVCCLLLVPVLTRPVLAQDLTIKVDGIDSNIPLEVSSGWPLRIQLQAANPAMLVQGKPTDPQIFFNEFGQPFARFVPPQGPISSKQYASLLFPDGNSVQFIPDVLPVTAVANPPQLLTTVLFSTSGHLVNLPPLSGGNYGASANLPGLVILTDAGTGLVFDQNFNLTTPLKQRNVAGFTSSVLYTLNNEVATPNQAGQFVITAQMAVPPELFVPVAEVDDNVGPLNLADCPFMFLFGPCSTATWMWRIDGGKLSSGSQGDLDFALSDRVSNIRVFAVNGKAPDVLVDLNGDGVVDSTDARLAGYEVISNEAKVQIRNFRQNKGDFAIFGPYGCTNTRVFEGSVRTDLDGNGIFTNGLFLTVVSPFGDCSLGSSHITPIPR